MSRRKNPYTAVSDFEEWCDAENFDWEEKLAEFYPKSAEDPQGFIDEHGRAYTQYKTPSFIWFGEKGRMLRLTLDDADIIYPIEGNIFYSEKLCAVQQAAFWAEDKIPFDAGYAMVSMLYCDDVVEMVQGMYDDVDFYEPDLDDIGKVVIQVRDGNHRVFGALSAGDEAYVYLSQNQYNEYLQWKEDGKKPNVLYKWLDERLV